MLRLVSIGSLLCVVVNAVCKVDPSTLVSSQDGFPNTMVISLNETLREVYSNEIPILPHYHGPNFKYVKEASATEHSHGKKVHFSCKALFQTALSYKGKDNEECDMTPEFQAKYTCDGHIHGSVACLHNPPEKQNGATKVWKWDEAYITEACSRFDKCAYYGSTACSESMIKYGDLYVKDKVGMTLGTQLPWLEGGLVAYGAKKVITVEYNPIESSFEKVSSIHPFDLAEKFVQSDIADIESHQVDFIYTFSSLEHDGLGRYGDPMNPYADLESIARAHCMLKKDGILFLAFGIGPDYIINANRIYGKLRLSMILPMWEPIDIINNRVHLNDTNFLGDYNNQPVWVLRKKTRIGDKH